MTGEDVGVRALLDWLDSEDPDRRRAAIAELESLTDERPGHVAWCRGALVASLEDPEPAVRAGACLTLAAVGADVESELKGLRLDPDSEVAETAREALSRLESAEPVEPVEPPEGGEAGSADVGEGVGSSDVEAGAPAGEPSPEATTDGSAEPPSEESAEPVDPAGADAEPATGTADPEPAGDPEPTPDSAGTDRSQEPEPQAETDDSGSFPVLAVAGYGLVGVLFALAPTFLVLGSPLDDFGLLLAFGLATGGGIVLIAAAGFRAAGRSASVCRGVGVFGGLLWLIGTVLIFLLF
jgi:hypothetical protein